MEKNHNAEQEKAEKAQAALLSDEIFGFIEHSESLIPEERIEYTGANKDYAPISVNKDTGEAALHSWAGFPWLEANKPYMVKSDGTPDYRLQENDYTRKTDGTASHVADASYGGGAFSWAQKIYKQEYMEGNDRIVNFSLSKREGFDPIGFIGPDGAELEGVWIPMFYGSIIDGKMKCMAGSQPCSGKTTAEEKAAIDAVGDRAKFYGGPIVETLTDLMLLFAKTSNLQDAFGYGNMNGYDGHIDPGKGIKQNAVIGGGQFYGTEDSRSLNKVFHSILIGSHQQWLRDPYVVSVNGKLKVSKDYAYDVTGESYLDTGINYHTSEVANCYWYVPHKYQPIPGFGALPVQPFKGSTISGGCDGFIVNYGLTAVAVRFGCCDHGLVGGPRAIHLGCHVDAAGWGVGAAMLLLPPAGVSVYH